MKAWKSLALMFLIILSVFTVSAQDLGGADMTVEESLVNFVTEVLGVSVTSASDVLLYLVAPIIGFYFLISNFGKEGYNHFQERLERRDYYESEEDLPTGMKLFSLITSFITVVSVGRIAPSLILIIGGLAFLLGIMMFLGLFNTGGNNNNGGGNGGGNGGEGDGGNGNDDNDGGGATRGDYIERVSEAAENATGAAADHLDQRYDDQKKEAFRYFQSDFLNEFEAVESDIVRIRQDLNQAENEVSSSNMARDEFKKMKNRARDALGLVRQMEREKNDDLSGPTPINYDISNLGTFIQRMHDSSGDLSDKGLRDQITALNKGLESLTDDSRASPPHDVFDEVHQDIKLITALGHFMHYYPEYEELSQSSDAANECLSIGVSEGVVSSPVSPGDIQKLMNLADPNLKNEIFQLIESLETLAEKELSISKSELKTVKQTAKDDGRIHSGLRDILQDIDDGSKYSTGSASMYSGHKGYLEGVDDLITNEIHVRINSLESRLGQDEKYETKTYKRLKKLQEKI
jgi:ElaB/YqjD/DUF883 family membrane-anchored ribosome-binding protein